MPHEQPPAEGAALRFFRFSEGLNEQEFGAIAGVTAHAVGQWERGKVPLSAGRLEELLAPWEVPREAIDAALLAHALRRPRREPLSPVAPPEEDRGLIDRAAAAVGWTGARATRAELDREAVHRQARHHRAWAAERWSSLAHLPAERLADAIEGLLGDDRSWALAETLCLASAKAAAHRAEKALHLARLAVRLAEHAPGPERWCLRTRGWCEPFLGNAWRVAGDLAESERVFASADDLWERGKGGDPAGLLDGSRRLDLKASLLMYQEEHFEEAQALLDQALEGARDDGAQGRLLIMKASALGIAGEYEEALEVLERAEPKITEDEQRLLFAHRFNRAVWLAYVDRYPEAEALLPLVETLTAELGNELDRVRAHWLRGRICAGLGRREEALAALSEVRRYLQMKKIAYDFALVSLEVAEIHLHKGQTRVVQGLAEEMVWVFKSQAVHEEALAALELFCRAAEAEELQAGWTRRLIKYLYRAQHNPRLHFEA